MPAHVVVVDDDPGIREVVRDTLEEEGYEVDEATNGQEALSHIATTSPDLVLLDLNMPLMSGWQLQKQLRVLEVVAPVVFMTAGNHAQAEAEQHQAAGYLAKPFHLDELVEVVERFTAAGARHE